MSISVDAYDPSVGVRRRHLPSFAGEESQPTKSPTSSSVGNRPVLLRVYLSVPSTVTSNWPDRPMRNSMSAAPSFWRLSLTRRACGL
jgi:hypothetical protein